jgi:hypothetical protein
LGVAYIRTADVSCELFTLNYVHYLTVLVVEPNESIS